MRSATSDDTAHGFLCGCLHHSTKREITELYVCINRQITEPATLGVSSLRERARKPRLFDAGVELLP